MAVRREIVRNTKGMQKRLGHSIGYGKKETVHSRNSLEAILYKDNFNRAYKRVKANRGAPGIDSMTIEEALPYLKEHQQEITDRIYRGKYTPSPVRRVEIPKPDGGVRKLGIPTVVDRTLQQAITQRLVPIYEPLFADDSYGYRPQKRQRRNT